MDAYGKALQEAFDSKTPAQHLVDSKYIGRGLSTSAFCRLFEEQNQHLPEETGYVFYALLVEAGANSIVTRPTVAQAELDVGHRLLKRVTKGGTIKRIAVHRRVSAVERNSSISFPTVMF